MKKSHLGSMLLIVVVALVFGTVSLAQTTITYGERVTGQVSAAQPQTAYIFTGAEGDVVSALVIGISPGMLPTLGLNGPAGQQLAFSGGDSLSAVAGAAQVTVRLPSSGTYALQVGALNNAQGDFLLALDGGPVTSGEVSAGGSADVQLDPNNPQQVLMLTGTGDDAPNMFFPFSLSGTGFIVQIFNAEGETVALVKAAFGQFSVGLMAGTTYYAILTLDDESATITASLGTAEQGSAPAAATGDACTVTTSAGVNVRSGPGTVFEPPIGSLSGSAPVTGQTTTGWYQINYNGLTGYVSASVVTVTGNCASVPTVTGPPPPAPTAVPPTPVPPPTSPPPPPPPPPPASTEDTSG